MDPDRAELVTIRSAIARATNREPMFLGSLSAGDAYYTIQSGIPGVWVGPGDPSLLHATNERLQLEDLVAAARVYTAIVLAYSGISS